MLRQLMRQARQRIAKGGSVIRTSVSTFMEFIGNNPNAFRLLLVETNVPLLSEILHLTMSGRESRSPTDTIATRFH